MNRHHEVVIAGAGMVGLTTAALLSRQPGIRVTVIDAGSKPAFSVAEKSLRVSAVAPGSAAILSRAGAWEEILATRVCPYRDMRVWDERGSVDGPETLRFDAAEFGVPELGHIVENALVQHALLTSLEQSDVTLIFETPIESLVRRGDRYELRLANGVVRAPDLLVGADGAGSFVRRAADIGVRSWPYAQKAFVTMLRPGNSHRYTAWQRFLEDGPLGILPLADGCVSIVWSTTPERADAALTMSDSELAATLTTVSDGVLGSLRPAGPRGVFPLQSQYASAYVRAGLVLVGDAAHAVHPLAGQGVNLGMADAAALANVLERALAAGENPGDLPTLRAYERARKGANQAMLFFVHHLNRLFSNRSDALARLRGIGMYCFNRSGPIRSHVVATALGIQ